MGECGVLQIRMDLLDDDVVTMGFVGTATVSRAPGSVVVKKAWNRQMSNNAPWAWSFFGRRSGMRRTTSRPARWWAFFWEANAMNGISATSACEIQVSVSSS
nr:hypothetical protein [Rhodococcus sp. DK17]